MFYCSCCFSANLEKEIREDEQRLKDKDVVIKEYHEKSHEKVREGAKWVEFTTPLEVDKDTRKIRCSWTTHVA